MPFVRSPSVLSYHDDIEFMASTMAGDACAPGRFNDRRDQGEMGEE